MPSRDLGQHNMAAQIDVAKLTQRNSAGKHLLQKRRSLAKLNVKVLPFIELTQRNLPALGNGTPEHTEGTARFAALGQVHYQCTLRCALSRFIQHGNQIVLPLGILKHFALMEIHQQPDSSPFL